MSLCSRCNNEILGKHPYYCQNCVRYHNRKWAAKRGVPEKFIPIVTNDSKQCAKCREVKPLENFSNSKRGRIGKSAYCKPCASAIQMQTYTKEERRLRTKKYRKNNLEWVRSLHRVIQRNRVSRTKVQSDGTVTPDFINSLYNLTICYYCRRLTIRSRRSLEHKQPLSKGGLHSINNLTMCCLSCNSAKKDKTEEQFINYLKQNPCQKSPLSLCLTLLLNRVVA